MQGEIKKKHKCVQELKKTLQLNVDISQPLHGFEPASGLVRQLPVTLGLSEVLPGYMSNAYE